MFLTLGGNSEQLSHQISRTETGLTRILSNGLVFAGWDKNLIEKGDYFYAFSHMPFYQFVLPPQTFSFTFFRDPVKRVLSHYKMLYENKITNEDPSLASTEGSWLGNSLGDFLERLPSYHLLNQLYMFSPTANVDEALTNVHLIGNWFFTENFSLGVQRLSSELGLPLKPIHTRKSKIDPPVSNAELAWLRELLEPEYIFLNQLQRHQPSSLLPIDIMRIKDLRDQAITSIQKGDYRHALDLLSQAKTQNQPIEEIDYLRAHCFIRMNQILAAMEALKEELKYFPDNANAIQFLGNIEQVLRHQEVQHNT